MAVKFQHVDSINCKSSLSPDYYYSTVLVLSGCYNKNIINWMAYTTNIYFSHFWRFGSQIGAPALSDRDLFGVSFIRALIPFLRPPPSHLVTQF